MKALISGMLINRRLKFLLTAKDTKK